MLGALPPAHASFSRQCARHDRAGEGEHNVRMKNDWAISAADALPFCQLLAPDRTGLVVGP